MTALGAEEVVFDPILVLGESGQPMMVPGMESGMVGSERSMMALVAMAGVFGGVHRVRRMTLGMESARVEVQMRGLLRGIAALGAVEG
jgi:hypothetical protein